MDLTDEQWNIIKLLIPEPPKRPDGRGRPRRNNREILNGILWIMRTGAKWKDFPERYLPYQTCHRRFQEWVRSGAFDVMLKALKQDMKERGDLDLTECFIDGTFVIAKKGGKGWERPSGASEEGEVPGWTQAPLLLKMLESGTIVCLAPELSPHPGPF